MEYLRGKLGNLEKFRKKSGKFLLEAANSEDDTFYMAKDHRISLKDRPVWSS